MAGQEEPKKAAPGQSPAPIKLRASGLAGATQHLTHPVDTADRTATVPISKAAVGGKPLPKPQSSALPPEAPAPGVRTGSDDKTMRLRKNPSALIKQTPQAPAGAPSPSAQTIKLTPSGGTPASAPTIKLTPAGAAGAPSPSAQTIKLTPAGGTPASAQTIKLMPQASAQTVSPVKLAPNPAAQTVKLTPSPAAQTVSPVKLAPNPAAQTVKLAPSPAAQTVSPVKLTPSPAAQTVKLSEAGDAAPAPASGAKPASAIPGAKQTIKLRPSSVSSSTVTAVPPPAGGPVTLNAGPSGKTIKLVPVGNGGAKVVPSAPAPEQQSAAPAAPAAPVQQQPAAAPAQQPAAAPAQQQPAASAGQTVKLSLPGSGQPSAAGKPMGKTMKLSLRKPAGTPAAGTAGPSKVPELKLPGKNENTEIEDDAALKQEEEERPSIVFLLISIAAMLAVVFTVLLMSVQYANMYHGADVNIPGMTRLSGTR